jgi:trk system potassium uptake protein TrkH
MGQASANSDSLGNPVFVFMVKNMRRSNSFCPQLFMLFCGADGRRPFSLFLSGYIVPGMRIKLAMDKIQMFSYFIALCFLGSLALSLPLAYRSGVPVPYIDALFTAVSAVCVTGLSTVNMSVFSSSGFIVLALLIESGGLGLVTFFSIYALAPTRKISLVTRSMIRDFFVDDVSANPVSIVRDILATTISLQIALSIPLAIGFARAGSDRPLFDALFHAVSAFCNAGFSTYSEGMIRFARSPLVLVPVMLLIVLGGIGFTVLSDIGRCLTGRGKLCYHSKMALSATAVLILAPAIFYFVVESQYSLSGLGSAERVLNAFFQSVTPRTAGFASVSQSTLAPVSRLLTIVLMFIGGSPASIAGGIKTTTFLIVLLYAVRGDTNRRGFNIRGRNIGSSTVEKAFSIFAKSIILVLVSFSCLLVTETALLAGGKTDMMSLLFESVSAFATVGLTLDVTPALSNAGKTVIITTMFIGRTGVFAMALGFNKRERERFFEYPSANVMVG